MFIRKNLVSECLGTFWLTFAGCGAAVLSATQPEGGIGLLGVALAFGFAVLSVSYALGRVSGAHFNPAVTVGYAVAGRIGWNRVPLYVLAQLTGAVGAICALGYVASGAEAFHVATSMLAANGYGAHSPAGYSAASCFVTEFLLTLVYVAIVLGTTWKRRGMAYAPLAAGIALTLAHLISLPITNTSVNPARSTGPALALYALHEEWALQQLWMFWLAPLAGGAVAGCVVPWLMRPEADEEMRACALPFNAQR